jgi:hypothetical protein
MPSEVAMLHSFDVSTVYRPNARCGRLVTLRFPGCGANDAARGTRLAGHFITLQRRHNPVGSSTEQEFAFSERKWGCVTECTQAPNTTARTITKHARECAAISRAPQTLGIAREKGDSHGLWSRFLVTVFGKATKMVTATVFGKLRQILKL